MKKIILIVQIKDKLKTFSKRKNGDCMSTHSIFKGRLMKTIKIMKIRYMVIGIYLMKI